MGTRTTILLPALALAAVIAGCGGSGSGETGGAATTTASQAGAKLTKIGDFSEPVYVDQPREERGDLYIVEKGGTVRVLGDGGEVLSEPFLDISDEVSDGSEQGLLSIAFPPDYADTGLLYVNFTNADGDTRVVEYRRSQQDPLRVDPGSARVVLSQDQPFENHNGGQLQFDAGGALYIGFGDGGSAGDPDRNAQNPDTFLGKIVRIDDPARPGSKPRIWADGLRNPWRFSFDRKTAALTIGDVGQDRFEEIDYVRDPKPVMNFGWSAFEADARFNKDQTAPGAIPPVLSYGRAEGCSVTGGYIVRDSRLAGLVGRYIYGDYCAGQLRGFAISTKPGEKGVEATGDRALGLEVPQLTSFGEDSRGHLYAASQAGPVYRIDPSG